VDQNLLWLALVIGVLLVAVLGFAIATWRRASETIRPADLELKHRAMLTDLHTSMAQQSDRIAQLQLALAETLGANRESLLARMGEEARAEQELLQTTLRTITQQLADRAESMSRTVDARLEQISGKVGERLDEGSGRPTRRSPT
jgi:DNA recombination protein RmuC